MRKLPGFKIDDNWLVAFDDSLLEIFLILNREEIIFDRRYTEETIVFNEFRSDCAKQNSFHGSCHLVLLKVKGSGKAGAILNIWRDQREIKICFRLVSSGRY